MPCSLMESTKSNFETNKNELNSQRDTLTDTNYSLQQTTDIFNSLINKTQQLNDNMGDLNRKLSMTSEDSEKEKVQGLISDAEQELNLKMSEKENKQ